MISAQCPCALSVISAALLPRSLGAPRRHKLSHRSSLVTLDTSSEHSSELHSLQLDLTLWPAVDLPFLFSLLLDSVSSHDFPAVVPLSPPTVQLLSAWSAGPSFLRSQPLPPSIFLTPPPSFSPSHLRLPSSPLHPNLPAPLLPRPTPSCECLPPKLTPRRPLGPVHLEAAPGAVHRGAEEQGQAPRASLRHLAQGVRGDQGRGDGAEHGPAGRVRLGARRKLGARRAEQVSSGCVLS